jgi:hypothetical protein
MGDYAMNVASQPSALTRVGGYLSSGGDVGKIVSQAVGENQRAASGGSSLFDNAAPMVNAGGSTVGSIGAQTAAPAGDVTPAINAAPQAPEGVSYNGAEDYLKSLHEGFGGNNG